MLVLGWLRVVVQGYRYSCSNIDLDSNFQKNVNELGSKIGLGRGWLRAGAQSYSYSCSKIGL